MGWPFEMMERLTTGMIDVPRVWTFEVPDRKLEQCQVAPVGSLRASRPK
jgi:hypothetical protein